MLIVVDRDGIRAGEWSREVGAWLTFADARRSGQWQEVRLKRTGRAWRDNHLTHRDLESARGFAPKARVADRCARGNRCYAGLEGTAANIVAMSVIGLDLRSGLPGNARSKVRQPEMLRDTTRRCVAIRPRARSAAHSRGPGEP